MSKRHSYTCSPPGGGDDKVWFQKLRPDQVHKRALDGAKWKSASDSLGICLHPGKPVKYRPFSSTSVDAPKPEDLAPAMVLRTKRPASNRDSNLDASQSQQQ